MSHDPRRHTTPEENADIGNTEEVETVIINDTPTFDYDFLLDLINIDKDRLSWFGYTKYIKYLLQQLTDLEKYLRPDDTNLKKIKSLLLFLSAYKDITRLEYGYKNAEKIMERVAQDEPFIKEMATPTFARKGSLRGGKCHFTKYNRKYKYKYSRKHNRTRSRLF